MCLKNARKKSMCAIDKWTKIPTNRKDVDAASVVVQISISRLFGPTTSLSMLQESVALLSPVIIGLRKNACVHKCLPSQKHIYYICLYKDIVWHLWRELLLLVQRCDICCICCIWEVDIFTFMPLLLLFPQFAVLYSETKLQGAAVYIPAPPFHCRIVCLFAITTLCSFVCPHSVFMTLEDLCTTKSIYVPQYLEVPGFGHSPTTVSEMSLPSFLWSTY